MIVEGPTDHLCASNSLCLDGSQYYKTGPPTLAPPTKRLHPSFLDWNQSRHIFPVTRVTSARDDHLLHNDSSPTTDNIHPKFWANIIYWLQHTERNSSKQMENIITWWSREGRLVLETPPDPILRAQWECKTELKVLTLEPTAGHHHSPGGLQTAQVSQGQQ